MNVVVTAGGRPAADDPLYSETQGNYKALLDLAGKSMLQWVLDALSASQSIRRIVVVGLPPQTRLVSAKPLSILDGHGDMLSNIQAGAREIARWDAGAQKLLVCSSDIPAITPVMVDWLVEQVMSADADIYYNVIERAVMEARFPTSRRTYLNLKGLQVCGGDFNAVSMPVALGNHPTWTRLIESRKSPLRQAALVGIDTLLLLLLRQLDLPGAEARASRSLNLRGRVLRCPFAEMGMDVDKPFQLDILRAHLTDGQGGR